MSPDAPPAGEKQKGKGKEGTDAKGKGAAPAARPPPGPRIRKSVLEKMERVPRRRGEFSYRGYTLEQLQALEPEDLASLLPARIRRKLNRGLSPEEKRFLEKISGGAAKVKTHLRRMVILPVMVGKEVQIHDGKAFQPVTIAPEMVGHYLGEFTLTRKRVKHGSAGIGATRSSKFIPLK